MTIQTQFQVGDLGFPLDCAGFDPFFFNLQLEKQILLQQQYPEKTTQKFIQNHQPWIPDPQNIDSHSVYFIEEMQRENIHQYLKSESEKLALALQEKTSQNLRSLMQRIEFKAQILFQEKDEEIALAKMKRMELEEFLTRLEKENQEQRRAVEEQEAMVASLCHTLDQMREKFPYCFNGAYDEESTNRGGDAIDERKKKMICRVCNSRISNVFFWPCRHISSCKQCEKLVDSCPICNTVKKACVEDVIF